MKIRYFREKVNFVIDTFLKYLSKFYIREIFSMYCMLVPCIVGIMNDKKYKTWTCIWNVKVYGQHEDETKARNKRF